MTKQATVIVVRYNQPEIEEACLRSVRQHTDLGFHRLMTEYNYTRDMNLGALWNELIGKVDTEFVCLLNSDTEVEAGWLDGLIRCATVHDADAVGPMTNGTCGTEVQKFGKVDKGGCVQVEQLSGFCLLLRMDSFRISGGFREDFPFYGQESNLLQRLGRKFVCREVEVKHLGGASVKGAGRQDEERKLSNEFWAHDQAFDWGKRIAILGSHPGNPFPLWAGIDDAVAEFERQGTPVRYQPIPTNQYQIRNLMEWKPDVLLVVTQRPLDPYVARDLAEWKGPAKGLWFNDLRRPETDADQYAGIFDRVFLCFNQDHEEWSKRTLAPVSYMPQGSRIWPELKPLDIKGRVVFIGGVTNSPEWHYGRAEIVHEFKADVLNKDLKPDRAKIERRTPDIYRQYQFCLSMSPKAIGYQSLRLYNILAYGGLVLQKDFPERNRMFLDGVHLFTFDEPSEILLDGFEKSWSLEDIRKRGWRLSQAKHTGMQRIMNMTANLTTTDQSFWGYL